MAQKKIRKSVSWEMCQLGEVPVGGGSSWRKFQFGEVPVGEVPVWGLVPVGGQNLTHGRFFSSFLDGKNLTPFSALNDLK